MNSYKIRRTYITECLAAGKQDNSQAPCKLPFWPTSTLKFLAVSVDQPSFPLLEGVFLLEITVQCIECKTEETWLKAFPVTLEVAYGLVLNEDLGIRI